MAEAPIPLTPKALPKPLLTIQFLLKIAVSLSAVSIMLAIGINTDQAAGEHLTLAPTKTPAASIRVKGTIKIVSQSPLTGQQASLGIAIQNGVALAVQKETKSLTDLGWKLENEALDDKADPATGVENAQKIVDDTSILAVVGHLNSRVAIPASEVYAGYNLAMVSPANTNALITDRTSTYLIANRVSGRDDNQGPVAAKYAATVLKAHKVYVISDKTAFGLLMAGGFVQEARTLGLQVLAQKATDESSDFDSILTPIVALKPDVLYYGGSSYEQAAALFKQAREHGITAQFLSPDAIDLIGLVKDAGDAAVGLIFTTTAGPTSLFPEAAQFMEDYKAAYNTDYVETYAPEAYAATQVVIAGLTKAITLNGGKLPSRQQVAAAIRATKGLKTVIGSITCDIKGDMEAASYYVGKGVSSYSARYYLEGNTTLEKFTFPFPLTPWK